MFKLFRRRFDRLDFRQYSHESLGLLREEFKTSAWQVHSYGELEKSLQLSSVRMPIIRKPTNLLVRVDAASVNPIDLLMCGGYGHKLMNILREFNLPITLGRDFSGVVISKGHEVDSRLCVGSKVYGFKPIHEQGTFSRVIEVDQEHVCEQPEKLSYIESASLVYAAMTAWSGLFVTGGLLFKESKGMRALILGASGGVGTCAVQLLKSQGCIVCATCSEDAVPLVLSLGADEVFNYKDSNFYRDVANFGRFHVILDCAKFGYENIPQSWSYDIYVTLNSPLLLNTDEHGIGQGLCKSAKNFWDANFKNFGRKYVRWGFFMPINSGLKFIHSLVLNEELKPTIHKVFKYDNIIDGLRTVAAGHLRGKVVIDFK